MRLFLTHGSIAPAERFGIPKNQSMQALIGGRGSTAPRLQQRFALRPLRQESRLKP